VENDIHIYGAANFDFYDNIPSTERSRCVILIDIEGAEFDIITRKTFEIFSKAIFIIELHHWVAFEGVKTTDLISFAEKTHSITFINHSARDLSSFPELHSYSDNDRGLICSEGRPSLMRWMRLDPRDS
jgi:hypothetical protein